MNDRECIEYSLIPALLESYLLPIHKVTNDLEGALIILNAEFKRYLKGSYKLHRRSDRIANKIINYTREQKFDSRKAVLMVTEWLRALIEAGALILEENTPYWNLLEEIGEVIQVGYNDIEDFDKIDASAISHVSKIHKIAQAEGYFL